jgi:hypothetical protein
MERAGKKPLLDLDRVLNRLTDDLERDYIWQFFAPNRR